MHHAYIETKFAAQSPVIISNACWQPKHSSVFTVCRLIVLRSKGSFKLIVESKIFLLAGQAVALQDTILT